MTPIEQFILSLRPQGVELWLDEAHQLRYKAPKAALTPALRTQLKSRKQEVIDFLKKQDGQRKINSLPQATPDPGNRYTPFPLTDVQEAYWLGRGDTFELSTPTHAYEELALYDVELNRLTEAWQQLINRHDMLRAIILPSGQQQILAEVPTYLIQQYDLRQADSATIQPHLASVRDEMFHRSFPADQWPLFELRLTQLPANETRLHLNFDMLIGDWGSYEILLREWAQLYHQPDQPLSPIGLSFRDYILAEKRVQQSTVYQRAAIYWQERIPTLPPAPELPLAIEPATLETVMFSRYQTSLELVHWQQLKRQATTLGLTPTVLLLTLFSEILTYWSSQPRFTLNLTLFNRLPLADQSQIDAIVGDFTSLTMLAVDNSLPHETLAQRAKRLQSQLWQDLEHRSFSGVQVLRQLTAQQNSAGQTLMPVVFTSGLGVLDKGGSWLGETVHGRSQTPQVWLDSQAEERDGTLWLTWDVVDALFPEGLIDTMFKAYITVLERLAVNETQWYTSEWHTSAPMLLPSAQQAQQQAVNLTEQSLIADGPDLLHTLFLHQVKEHAQDLAIITPHLSLTYGELAQRTLQVASWLRQRGAKPNTLVAVVMEKGWEQVVAVLGIQLAGAAYLPIDPDLPAERRQYLLQQGEVRLVVTQSWLNNRLDWPGSSSAIERLSVDQHYSDLHPALDITDIDIINKPTDIAYVIYTSGSTGQPKGVVIDHRGAVNTVLDINHRYGITSKDRVLAISALNFDLSVYDIFGLLAAGGTIVIPDAEKRIDPQHWHELINHHDVTVWNTVPALMQMLVEYEEESGRATPSHPPVPLFSLRTTMMSGDWIPVTLPDRIKACYPDTVVYSLGGATEASIWSIDYPIKYVDPTWTSIPYGKPLANQTFYVLDANLNPRPTWVPGDLYIGGIGLALGYWKDEERTNASFITHSRTGERLYKTGDLGRYLPATQGEMPNIEFLGRADFQVKIRGHRIELGEIEATLLQHPSMIGTVVNPIGEANSLHKQLVAYVVQNTELPPTAVDSAVSDRDVGSLVPDQYTEEPDPTVLTDPLDRLEFKLSQLGVQDLAGKVGESGDKRFDKVFEMPKPVEDNVLRHRYLSRQSYRHFAQDPITMEQFSAVLSNLRQLNLDNAPLPKYRYPSAGSLYPVQTYLYIKPHRIEGLVEGFYYYQPDQHALAHIHHPGLEVEKALRMAASNQPIFDQAAFALFLVGQFDAISPMYGDLSREFCLLEAGYMSQLLMMEAITEQLGLCPLGGLQTEDLIESLHLTESQHLLHTLVGGRIEPVQMSRWLESPQPIQKAASNAVTHDGPASAKPVSWQEEIQGFLETKLPSYMMPTAYVRLDALPLSANGKIDRNALPMPDIQLSSADRSNPQSQKKEMIAPRTATEKQVANLWDEVLNRQQSSIEDDFFEIGGDSLTATRLLTRLRQTFPVELSLRLIFANPTIKQLAGIIDAQSIATIDPLILQRAMAKVAENVGNKEE